jgi:hypothetical protein
MIGTTANGEMIMCDRDKRILVEEPSRSNEGWAKICGVIFVAIIAVGILGHTLTSAWLMIARRVR